MADVAPAPRHPGPTATDTSNYAPAAVLAVIALIVAVFYAVLLLGLAVMAFRTGQPFVLPLMLVLPVGTLVLTFAARRQIQNSEGTRAGLPLVNAAWWISVLGGFGYASYLVAYQLGVRQDAANSFRAWAKNVNEIDLSDPKNPGFFYALDGTLDPEQQDKIKIGNAEVLYKQRKPQVTALRHSYMIRLANRNPGQLEFTVGGLDKWEYDASGQKGELTVQVKCPEGEFGFNIPMMAKRVEGQWRWQIGSTPSGNLWSLRMTPYGQKIWDMEQAGYSMVNDAFLPAVGSRAENPILIRVFGEPQRPSYPLKGWVEARMAAAGSVVWLHPEPKDYDAQIGKLFDPVEKGDPVREAEQRRSFVAAWRAARLYAVGRTIRQNTDIRPILQVLPDGYELKVPLELQPPGMEIPGAASRGMAVLRCDDPAFVKMVHDLRAAAATDPLAEPSSVFPPPGSIPWRLTRIESDMKPVAPDRPEGPQSMSFPGGGG